MIPETVHTLLKTGLADSVAALMDDSSAVFNVDWREEDDAIPEYCESVLHTGSLAAEVVNIDDDPGFEIYIAYRGKRTKVPLVVGPEDRHITLHTLNQVLAPDYEVRVCIDSKGSDTLTFLPLSSSDWSALEARYGARVAKHFGKIAVKPNLFTDSW